MTRNAFITGSGGGLGPAVVERFAAAGWNVTAPRRAEVDLNDPDAVRRAVEAAAPLHALVNLAGGFAAGEPVAETPVEAFEASLRLNLRTTYVVCHAAIPVLAADGAIVCTSSATASAPFAGSAGYAASKAGVTALARAIAKEGARCNILSPSLIDTPANRESMPDADPGDWVAPEEIGRVIRFLCSSDSSPISGAWIPVYGKS
jgi:NAD(P)-dependent dehydrogenase (short-subunit alcohol dehydrogenase family)